MLTLSPSLSAHQRGRARRPAVLAYATDTRFAAPVLALDTYGAPADTTPAPIAYACQVDAAADPFENGNTLAIRNNAGALDYQPSFPNDSWSNLDTVTAGQGFALAYDAVNAEYLLAYGDGNDLKVRTFDPAGPTWSSSTTVVTEASPIGQVAVAVDDAGDACAFYNLGNADALKRLRRTTGTWAASGTTWSRAGDVATITGLAAYWKDDYVLAITGSAETTGHLRCWSVVMGDTDLPANAWSGLIPIAEADAASGLVFNFPSIALVDSVPFVAFRQHETGDVAADRIMIAHAMLSAGPLGYWTEPAPSQLTDDFGAVLAHWPNVGGYPTNDGRRVTVLAAASTMLQTYHAYAARDLSGRLLSLKWKMTPDSFRLTAEFDDRDGLATSDEENPAAPGGYVQDVRIGCDLLIQHGYFSDEGAAEYGLQLRCQIRKLSRAFEPGRRTLTIEADGPWEALDRFHAVQAWTAPAGTTRGLIFQRVAARAGLDVTAASGTRAPTTAWTTDAPSFAIAANERGDTTLRRLLAPTTDFLRMSATGGFEICGFSDTSHSESYHLNFDPGLVGRHPFVRLVEAEELEPNWLRLQGPDRYADAFHVDDVVTARNPLGRGPWFQLLRDIDADDDTKATDRALAALQRVRQLTPTGQLVAPAHVGQELYDIVRTYYLADSNEGSVSPLHRVIGLALEYRRASASGAPGYTTTLDLADRRIFA